MRKKFKITLVVFLVVVLGCFSQVFAASNQNTKLKKSIEARKSVKLLDSATTTNYVPKKDYSQNLIANYKLDETSGTTCIDSVHNDSTYNGVYNGTTSVTDSDGTYRKFNGTSDCVSFTNPIIPTDKMSLKFQVKCDNVKENIQQIFCNVRGSSYYNGYEVIINTDGKLEVEFTQYSSIDGSNYAHISSNNSICDGKWHTILIENLNIKNQTNGIKMYIDDLVNPVSQGTVPFSNSNDWGENLGIGFRPDAKKYYFEGCLKDIEIYNDVIEYNNASEAINLNKTTDTLNVGQTDNLIATVTPDNVSNKTVKWASSDPTTVSVDANGKITALKAGTATITATTTDGSNLKASCVVTVTEPVTPTPTTGNRATLTINMVNGSSKQYDLSEDELNSFLSWYNGMTNPVSAQCYTFNNPITGPYLNNKDYIPFNKIDDFKIQEYTK